MNKNLPRVLIAAPKSGSGKTIITCGLLKLFNTQANNIISYKCGPDYIDPMFHRKVLGINGGNLDSFFMDKESLINALASANENMAIIEGVMGIYDGLDLTSDKASAYEIATITATPVILVVDGKGAARTLISLVKGILADDCNKLIKGLIINNISSAYYAKLKPVMEHEFRESGYSIKLIGNVPHIKDLRIDSRHLGLMLPDEIEDIHHQIDLVAKAIEDNCSVDEIINIMNDAASLVYSKKENYGSTDNIRLAVARDEAFCFYYKENLQLLVSKGVELVLFSPLCDSHLPENINGLLLGGGYPENYLEKLSNNKTMLEDIKTKIDLGLPVLAECGGFIYLHKRAQDVNGMEYTLAGVVDGTCSYTGKLVRFGYVEMNGNANNKDALSNYIVNMKGHEFHYYDSTCNGDAIKVTKPTANINWQAGISNENMLIAFMHLYYPSNVEFIDAFINRMRVYKYDA